MGYVFDFFAVRVRSWIGKLSATEKEILGNIRNTDNVVLRFTSAGIDWDGFYSELDKADELLEDYDGRFSDYFRKTLSNIKKEGKVLCEASDTYF